MSDRPEIVPVGTLPPLGVVPKKMHAMVIRPSRYGEPETAFQAEEIEIPELAPDEVLVAVMAAGVNYNNVWAALGYPVDVIAARNRKGEPEEFHIGGSDASGIVYKVGSGVTTHKVGDEVVIHCGIWDRNDPWVKAGKDPMFAPSQVIWGYETNWGSFAQFTKVQAHQCLPRPKHLSWEEAAFVEPLTIGCYTADFVKNPQDKRVGILGAGPIGMSVLAALRGLGATRFWVTDKLDYRLEIARRMGAGWVGNPLKSDVVADISAGQPELLDVVVECCGQQAALDQAVHLLKPGGLLLIVGIPESFSISFEPHLLRRKELTIRNVRRQNHCTQKAIDLLDGRTIDFSPLFTHRFELKNSPAAFDLVAGYQDHVLKATVFLT